MQVALQCRLELKENKYILGEFIEFKGKQDDLLTLISIRRSKVRSLIVQKISMFDFGIPTYYCSYFTFEFRIHAFPLNFVSEYKLLNKYMCLYVK